MHDPTEGGLATGLWELAQAAHVGLCIDGDAIPILPECRTLCKALGLDPLGLIASGALVLACPRTGVEAILGGWAWERYGYPSVFTFAAGVAVLSLAAAARIRTR